MLRRMLRLAAAAIPSLVLVAACSQNPQSPVSPSVGAGGDTTANPDGSTLKVTAPTPVSPGRRRRDRVAAAHGHLRQLHRPLHERRALLSRAGLRRRRRRCIGELRRSRRSGSGQTSLDAEADLALRHRVSGGACAPSSRARPVRGRRLVVQDAAAGRRRALGGQVGPPRNIFFDEAVDILIAIYQAGRYRPRIGRSTRESAEPLPRDRRGGHPLRPPQVEPARARLELVHQGRRPRPSAVRRRASRCASRATRGISSAASAAESGLARRLHRHAAEHPERLPADPAARSNVCPKRRRSRRSHDAGDGFGCRPFSRTVRTSTRGRDTQDTFYKSFSEKKLTGYGIGPAQPHRAAPAGPAPPLQAGARRHGGSRPRPRHAGRAGRRRRLALHRDRGQQDPDRCAEGQGAARHRVVGAADSGARRQRWTSSTPTRCSST